MFMIERFEFAYPWLRNTALHLLAQNEGPGLPRVVKPRAVAFFQIHQGIDPVLYPSLRDRTGDVRLMLLGLAGRRPEDVTTSWVNTGSEFYRLGEGFEPVGAQFGQTYRLMVA